MEEANQLHFWRPNAAIYIAFGLSFLVSFSGFLVRVIVGFFFLNKHLYFIVSCVYWISLISLNSR